MKVPLNWLKKYLPLNLAPTEIAHYLTLMGLEVETIDGMDTSFKGVVIASIDTVSPHPSADRLKIARIFDGKEYYQVVCGDSTIQPGMVVAFAKVGAVLGLDTDQPLKIKEAKLRGVESEGMLSSADELGLVKEKAPTILHLPQNAPLGTLLEDYLYNPIMDVTLTPNLGHCRSMYGIARELSAVLNIPCELPRIPKIHGSAPSTQSIFRLTNKNEALCPIYTARYIEGVRIAPSPAWLTALLESAGVKPINNIVDILNYVMLELGQPMHAFDADKLNEKHIVIDVAKQGVTITTLDQKTHELPEGTLLIQDGSTPIAIAGIMGGLESSITEKTTNVLLEAALFSSSIIRKKSRELSLRSESSSRFENEIDRGGIERAMDRAVELIAEIAGGKASPDAIVSGSLAISPRFISVRVSHINRLLGTALSLGEVVELLKRLEFEVSSDDDDLLQVKAPSYRNDVHLEVDVIEEVGRLYGYNHIERKPPLLRVSNKPHNPFFLLERNLKKRLVAEGLQEFITCNLISPELCNIELENGLVKSECISVLKPSSQDQSILRSSMLPGHLLSISLNKRVKNHDIAAFEIGRIHFKEGERLEEKMALAITLTGNSKPHHFQDKPQKVHFYDIKGLLENVLNALLVEPYTFSPSDFKGFHPFQQAAIWVRGKQVGVLGQVHPETLEHFDLQEPLFFAELELSELVPFVGKTVIQKALPQFPSSERDLTLTLRKQDSLSPLLKKLHALQTGALKEVLLLDIYEHPSIGEENRNVTFRFTYRDDSTTLDYETVESLHKKVLENLRID